MSRWHRLVLERAAAARVDLPVHAVDELAAHLEDLYAAARAAGLTDTDAVRRAVAALDDGPMADVESIARRIRRPAQARPLHHPPPFTLSRSLSMRHALTLAIRQFSRNPLFALIVVLVVGVGTGAGVAVYSVVDAVLLQPLPYREPDRLMMLWETNHEQGLQHEAISPVNFTDYRELDVFEDAAAWWRPDIDLTEPGADPLRVAAVEAGGNLFAVLGVTPQLGPGFPADGPMFDPADRIVVISDRLWRTRFNSDGTIIGRLLRLTGVPYRVVGVMPPGFDFPGEIDLWQRSSWNFANHSRAAHFMEAVGRLAPGVTIERATAAIEVLGERLQRDNPTTNRAWRARLIPVLEDRLGYYRPALYVLFGAVGLLMVIASLNVASLLLTRTLSRTREVSVRSALGAAPRHLLTQVFAEAAVLALAGAVAGTLAAVAALPLLTSLTPVDIPRLSEATVNWRVLLFMLASAGMMTIVFSLVPAWLLLRSNIAAGLRTAERGSSRAGRWLYRGLVAGEVALACVLLIASGLLVRTVTRMMDVPIGVGRDTAVLASVQLPTATGATFFERWQPVAAGYAALLDQVRAQPGVRAAGASNFLPLDDSWRSRLPFAIEGRPPVAASDRPQAQVHSVTDGYFEAIGAERVSGRLPAATDRADRPGVVFVNETFAKRHFPAEPAVGQVLLMSVRGIGPLGYNLLWPAGSTSVSPSSAAPPAPVPPVRFEIVGVVRDIRNAPFGQPVEPAIYFSGHQFPFRAMYIAIDGVDTATSVAAIGSALRTVAPAVPLADARTWADRLRERTAEPRLLMTVLVCFGVLAAGLAVLGVYGLFSWIVALRRRELSIRLTLGARPSGVGMLIVRQAAWLAAIGVAAGWALIRLTDGLLARVLFEISPSDPWTTTGAIALLLVASLVACAAPAWRAMRTDPVNGLRAE